MIHTNFCVVVSGKYLLVNLFKHFLSTFLLFCSFTALSFSPTAMQLEQFKKLPKSQQEALAKQYGIDISDFRNAQPNTNDTSNEKSSISERPEKLPEKLTDEERFNPVTANVKPFGYSLFAGEPSTFMPNETASVPDEYLIGRGDQFLINFYRHLI